MKKCPYCAELIQEDAILCRYCGNKLTAPKIVSSETSGGQSLGTILGVVGGIIGTIYALIIAVSEWGILGAVVAIFVFPAAVLLAPIYGLLTYGDWWPVLLIYGLIGIAIVVGVREQQ